MMREVELKKLTPDAAEIPLLEEINREAFPPQEYVSIADMFSLKDCDFELLGVFADGDPAGFIALQHEGSCAYIFYFALGPNARGGGVGSRAMQLLLERYPGRQVCVDFEAVDENADNAEQRVRRREFYLRNGFHPTGWYLFYMQTEFEMVSSTVPFDKDEFTDLLAKLHEAAPEFVYRMYRKD